MNPKDQCVFNKDHNGDQVTVTFHVDDLLITSINEESIDELISNLSKDFECELVAKSGPEVSYLGMTLDFSNEKYVEIRMERCIDELVGVFEKLREFATPAGGNLLSIGDGALLADDKKALFHSLVAKALYISKRARPDIAVAVNFLTRRVSCPTTVDWKMSPYLEGLQHVLGWLLSVRLLSVRLCSS